MPSVMGLLLAVSVAAAPGAPRVVVLGVRSFDDSTTQRAQELQELTLTELSRSGRLDVIGQSDITALLGLERERQLTGCSDASSSCMAEIGAALGAPFLVSGSVGRAGKQLRVDLKLVQVEGGRVLAREGEVLQGEDDWYPTVTAMLRRLEAALDVGAPVAQAKGPSAWPWGLTGVGVAAAVGGAALMVTGAANATSALQTGSTSVVTDVAKKYDEAAGLHTAGVGLLIGGSVVAASGLLWAWLGRSESPVVSFAPSATGATLVVSGSF